MGCTSSSAVEGAGDGTAEPWLKSVKIIFVLGGPGSGKGTQCARICDNFGFVHLSAGDLLRQEVAKGSERGQECDRIMKEGGLVPVEVTLDLLKEAMAAAVAAQPQVVGFLIDGFPRELEQGKAFKAKFKRDCDFVLYFECSEQAMKARILKRAETSGRADDNEATIVKRLKTFTNQTVPVVQHYQKLNKLRSVNAERGIEEVYADVDALFRDHALIYSRIVFVLGGPGSGKGTQCVRLAQKCQYVHLSTGDLLRAEVAAQTDLGKRCAAVMQQGALVSVDDTLQLLRQAMLRSVRKDVRGFLIDGYPRELPQVQAFVEKFQRDSTFALYFECSETVMEQRILKRGETSGRADDNAEAAKKRLATFRAQTLPVVTYYDKKKILMKVNAEGSVDDIFEAAAKYF